MMSPGVFSYKASCLPVFLDILQFSCLKILNYETPKMKSLGELSS
jgi:hypothetical protein